jgi:hypothetical protein
MQRTIQPRKDSLKSIALDSGKVNQLTVGPDDDRRRVDRVMIEGTTVGSTEVLEVLRTSVLRSRLVSRGVEYFYG